MKTERALQATASAITHRRFRAGDTRDAAGAGVPARHGEGVEPHPREKRHGELQRHRMRGRPANRENPGNAQ